MLQLMKLYFLRKICTEPDVAFINGVLGSYARSEEITIPEYLGIDTSNYTTSVALYDSVTNKVKQFKTSSRKTG